MAGVDFLCPGKRKSAAFAGDEYDRAAKRIDRSDGEKKKKNPAKKMARLPQEEVDWILAQSGEPVYPPFLELKRRNPSLVPSPEEEKDEGMVQGGPRLLRVSRGVCGIPGLGPPRVLVQRIRGGRLGSATSVELLRPRRGSIELARKGGLQRH